MLFLCRPILEHLVSIAQDQNFGDMIEVNT